MSEIVSPSPCRETRIEVDEILFRHALSRHLSRLGYWYEDDSSTSLEDDLEAACVVDGEAVNVRFKGISIDEERAVIRLGITNQDTPREFKVTLSSGQTVVDQQLHDRSCSDVLLHWD